MQAEVFSSQLPILTFDHMDEVINEISAHTKPLALYLFTKKYKNFKKFCGVFRFAVVQLIPAFYRWRIPAFLLAVLA